MWLERFVEFSEVWFYLDMQIPGGCFAFAGNLHCFLPHGCAQGKFKGLPHTQTGMEHCLGAGTSPVRVSPGQEEGNRSAMLTPVKANIFSYYTVFKYICHILSISSSNYCAIYFI